MANSSVSAPVEGKNKLWGVITASSVGTLIEWYDFYIFGSLATILSTQFFPLENPTAAFLSTLATFAAGFIVRPFGALVFGRLGDLIGRKYTFLLTLVLMGGSTFAIGLIPGFSSIGYAAPILVLLLRLIQGLALGGEYGGAATYVAEHAPANKRGFYTSFIQTTATMGLFLSLGVILLIRHLVGVDAFNSWGWRIPFLLSSLLVFVSIVIRMKMHESPLFAKVKAEGKTVKNPLKESFGKKENLKMVLLALFGATAGQGVIWYTGQFYALSFIQKTMSIEFVQSNYIIAIGLLLATPFFIIFGGWSDKIGRRNIMMAGMLCGILFYRPIYKQMYALSDVTTMVEVPSSTKVERQTNKNEAGETQVVQTRERHFSDGTIERKITSQSVASKPVEATEIVLPTSSFWILVALVFVQVLFVTMVYGPIAAFLVELFPTNIRYTSMSLPYHIGNGVFGGLTPFIAISLTSLPGATPFDGLWYPIGVAALCLIIGLVYINKTTHNTTND
ncbi:MHS family proline/betaine transporter-like MFS transporter [Arcticibacter pallidicorallinus]|uniref:MHS family proline/betaine transporter-like MFS transporter n=1 Tax=Arcticibacter pallidicorallinus TaxID=1259464 RepID=A0A2T0U0J1_9SPHI|nr:MFS transporter [Arcticibacter pallidicorallinus]PRY51447.1 MHS family proline/betaine transporter-like MFS transporter [Arcticibacter pallidicorallinus]